MSTDPFAAAKEARERATVSTPIELMEVAKYGNPKLQSFVRENPDMTLQAIRLAETMSKEARDLVRAMNLQTVAERLQRTLRTVAAAPQQQSVETRVLPSDDPLVSRVRDAVQERLDRVPNQRSLWFDGSPKIVELEREINAEYVQPHIDAGLIVSGIVRIWIGPHPFKPNSHHDLAVQSVTLHVMA
jgi:hypothetical protein